MLIIDDFLPTHEFKKLQGYVTGLEFPWYYHSHASAAPGSYVPENAIESGDVDAQDATERYLQNTLTLEMVMAAASTVEVTL